MDGTFQLIAHRGAPMRAPENTRAAFLQAQQLGATHIETDVQLTADGIPVLCHDDTLERYGHGSASIGQLTLRELEGLDFGSWYGSAFKGEPILSLERFLAEFGTAFYCHIELKDAHPDTAGATLALLEQQNLAATLTSFHFSQLERARELDRDHPMGWLVKEVTSETIARACALRLTQLCVKADAITLELCTRARERGLEIRAWGCPRERESARAEVERLRRLQGAPCIGITVDELSWFPFL